MAYEVKFKSSVRKDLKNIDREVAARIIDTVLEKLSANPFMGEPLRGKFKGMYKYRVPCWKLQGDICRRRKRSMDFKNWP